MPFQDVDEISTQESRAPSNLNRVLRRIFVEDWNLKLLSLAITLALWFVVTGQNTPVNIHETVQLKFIKPDGLEISNEPPKSVDVLLTGSDYKLKELNASALIATVDVSDQRAGERVLRLLDRAHLDLPQGVTIDTFQPSAISIRLEPIITRQVRIEVKLDGTPAEGYEVYAVRPSKFAIDVRGPLSNVNALANAPTEAISVSGRREAFTAPNVAIEIFDPKLDVQEPFVGVEVQIGEHRVEKEFSEVRVLMQGADPQPATATVVVYGPPRELLDLKSADIKLLLPASGDASQATLQLPAALEGKLELRSAKPSKFKSSR